MSKKFSSWVIVIFIVTLICPLSSFSPQDFLSPVDFFSPHNSNDIYRSRVIFPNSSALFRLEPLGVTIQLTLTEIVNSW